MNVKKKIKLPIHHLHLKIMRWPKYAFQKALMISKTKCPTYLVVNNSMMALNYLERIGYFLTKMMERTKWLY
jgi:hypothetical protein